MSDYLDRIIRWAERKGVDPKIISALEAKRERDLDRLRRLFVRPADPHLFLAIPDDPHKAFLSKSYVVLAYNRHSVVVGLDDDGNLFLNWINNARLPVPKSYLYEDKWDAFQIIYTTDKDVKEGLGFTCECTGGGGIPPKRWCRVQGDLCIRAEPLKDIADVLERAMHTEVRRWLHITVIRRIRDLLVSKGFIPIMENDEIIICGINVTYGESWSREKITRAVHAIGGLVKDELYVSDIIRADKGIDVEKFNDHVDIYYHTANNEELFISVRLSDRIAVRGHVAGKFFNFARVRIDTSPCNNLTTSWCLRILRDCRRQLDGLIGWHTASFNRHVIEYYGYPRSIVLIYEPPLIEHEPVVFSFTTNSLIVLDRRITIKHPEHGTVELKLPFNRCRLRVDTTETIDSSDLMVMSLRNMFMLEHLMEGGGK